MYELRVSLLGRFNIESYEEKSPDFSSQNVRLLFSYLMLHRDSYQSRESLATLFWPEASISQSKAYLRKTLWHLQSDIEQCGLTSANDIILTEQDWLQINPKVNIWFDVAQLKAAFAVVENKPGRFLDQQTVEKLKKVIDLYHGDLLQGCYQEWCLHEREWLRQIYIILLDKLLGYCLCHHQYEMGVYFGGRILNLDFAQERTHQRLMRLHFMAGNRTQAIHQYQLCADYLKRELNVEPSKNTQKLFEAICDDELKGLLSIRENPVQDTQLVSETIYLLEQAQSELTYFQKQIDSKIQLLKQLSEK